MVWLTLDEGQTHLLYGNPEVTKVDLGVRKNPGILISDDLRDLEMLLGADRGIIDFT